MLSTDLDVCFGKRFEVLIFALANGRLEAGIQQNSLIQLRFRFKFHYFFTFCEILDFISCGKLASISVFLQ